MSKKPDTASRMADILSASRLAELRTADAPPSPAPDELPPSQLGRTVAKASPKSQATLDEPKHISQRGRPLGSKNAKPGKKSDEDYCPTTVYIRKETRTQVKQALLLDGSVEDVSDIVEELLQEWLKRRG